MLKTAWLIPLFETWLIWIKQLQSPSKNKAFNPTHHGAQVTVITLVLDQSDHIKQLPLYYINQKKIQFSNILYYYALWYCLSCLRFAFRIQKIFSLNENKLPKYLYMLIIINLIVLNSSPMVLVLSPDSKMVRNIKIG